MFETIRAYFERNKAMTEDEFSLLKSVMSSKSLKKGEW